MSYGQREAKWLGWDDCVGIKNMNLGFLTPWHWFSSFPSLLPQLWVILVYVTSLRNHFSFYFLAFLGKLSSYSCTLFARTMSGTMNICWMNKWIYEFWANIHWWLTTWWALEEVRGASSPVKNCMFSLFPLFSAFMGPVWILGMVQAWAPLGSPGCGPGGAWNRHCPQCS